MALIRSAALRGFRATVAELGGDADRFASEVGLSVAALDSEDLLIPVVKLAAVLRYASAKLGCPDLPLRIAPRQDLSMLGPLALAIRSCSTADEALTCAARYVFVHSPNISLSLEADPYRARGVAALRFGTPVVSRTHDPTVDLGLALLHTYLIELVGGPYGLRSVELPYLPLARLSVYEDFFHAPVRVEQDAALLRLPRTTLKRPLKEGGNLHLRHLAEAFLAEKFTSSAARDFAPQVRAYVQQSLGTTAPDIASVAAMFGLHPRTLQRRLSEEGTTFGHLLDDVRRHAARRYLTGTDMPMTQVAALLGLSEQSALSRCCRRWWGTTPRSVRRDHGWAHAG
jgi:AraC-like DNA-binding protein